MAARTRRVGLNDKTRLKIQTTQLIKRLENHALGKNKMTQTQIRAAEVVLKKALPDLSATEHSGQIDTGADPKELTHDDLVAIASSGSTGIAVKGRGKKGPPAVH